MARVWDLCIGVKSESRFEIGWQGSKGQNKKDKYRRSYRRPQMAEVRNTRTIILYRLDALDFPFFSRGAGRDVTQLVRWRRVAGRSL